MSKSLIASEFGSFEIKGQAKLTENQINSIQSTTPNLKTGATYFIPAQVGFQKEVEVNGEKVMSNRVAALEIINGNPTRVITIGISALRASYVGRAADGKPSLKMELRHDGNANGLYRPVAGQGMRVTTLDTPAPLEVLERNGEKTVKIAAPFAITVKGRTGYFQPVFERQGDGRYDMAVDDDMNAQLHLVNDYVLKADDASKYAHHNLATLEPKVADFLL